MSYFDFIEKLKEGIAGEEIIKQEFKKFMIPIANHFFENKMYYYGLDKKEQQNGKDGKSSFNFEYDVKSNSYFPKEYRKILLENRHEGINCYYKEQETNKNGWLWYSEADIVFFLWWAKDKKKALFCDGYYLFLKNIRNWFNPDNYEEQQNKYPSINNKNKWWTWNYIIPIESFPKNCILQIEKTTFKTSIEKSFFSKWFEINNDIKKETKPIIKGGMYKWLT